MILTIDTAGLPSSVSLLDRKNSKVVDRISWKKSHSQSEKTLKLIEKLLKRNDLGLADLKAVAVNKGPTDCQDKAASFTGLKVGVTLANSLKTVLNIPIFGVSLNGRKLEDIVLGNKASSSSDFINPTYPKPPNID